MPIFHHSGLFNSLYLTLEKRLGWELYAPIGTSWFEKGYWEIAKPYGNHPDTIKQYLDLRDTYFPTDGTPPLTAVEEKKPDHYLIQDFAYNYVRKHITLEQFANMDIDVIIASIPAHYSVYTKLRDKYHPKAKVVCHAGNMFNEIKPMAEQGIIKNFMGSIIKIPLPASTNSVFYRQEIDQAVFKYNPVKNLDRLTSFVIGLPKREIYDALKKDMPDFIFRAYGADQPFVTPVSAIAEKMSEATMGIHVKPRGDGWGHVWYCWGFSGRPLITNFSDYKDKIGAEIFEHKVTGIDLEQGTIKENADLIRNICQSDKLEQMCLAISKRTKDCVNYERETEKVKHFIENLI